MTKTTTPTAHRNTEEQLVRQMICESAERCRKINSDGHPCRHGIPHDEDSGCAVPCTSQRPIGSLCVPNNSITGGEAVPSNGVFGG